MRPTKTYALRVMSNLQETFNVHKTGWTWTTKPQTFVSETKFLNQKNLAVCFLPVPVVGFEPTSPYLSGRTLQVFSTYWFGWRLYAFHWQSSSSLVLRLPNFSRYRQFVRMGSLCVQELWAKDRNWTYVTTAFWLNQPGTQGTSTQISVAASHEVADNQHTALLWHYILTIFLSPFSTTFVVWLKSLG